MKQVKKYLIVIGGATATGKTALAIQLAQYFQTEILSADSRQFYREMSIGTAKPTVDELQQASHHFINSLSVQKKFSVGDFEKEALEQLESIFKKNDYAILVGGSGLFLRAVCEGLDEYPDIPLGVRQTLENLLEKEGIQVLQAELKERDPHYFEQVDLQNARRLIRALEVCRVSGRSFSSFQNQVKTPRPFTPIYILLEMERKILYDRINKRVHQMLEKGLLEEAQKLYPLKHLNALQTVGYQEFFEYFDSKISLEEAIELVKRNSRRYAKRQMTWFRKRAHWKAFLPSEEEKIIQYISLFSEGKQMK